jgi:hypothetical protein
VYVRVRTTPGVGCGQGSFFNKEIAPPLLGGAASSDNMEGRHTFDRNSREAAERVSPNATISSGKAHACEDAMLHVQAVKPVPGMRR